MIEVNLLPVKTKITFEFAGINLKVINIPFVLIAIVIYMLRPIAEDFWRKKVTAVQDAIKQENQNLITAKAKGRELKGIVKQIEQIELEEKQLQVKLEVVKSVIKIKKNPRNILLYVSKNIPIDVWLDRFIFGSEKIQISGFSSSYRSIGIFVENLKGSIFFGNSIKLEDSRTVTEEGSNKRKERFEISAIIERYE